MFRVPTVENDFLPGWRILQTKSNNSTLSARSIDNFGFNWFKILSFHLMSSKSKIEGYWSKKANEAAGQM